MTSITHTSPMSQALSSHATPLRSEEFDRRFVYWPPMVGILAALVAIAEPALWPALLIADLWLLGYHHVGATFTKLLGDRKTLGANRALLTVWPVLVLAATLALYKFVGIWAITTLYFYWQWFHYTRQSWGVAEAFRRRQPGSDGSPDRLYKMAFWAIPVAGVLTRSAQQPRTFLGADISLLAVPMPVAAVAVIIGAVLVGTWSTRRPGPAGGLTAYWVSHAAIFGFAYLVAPSVSVGWLAINIWHNSQYLAFVWHTNTKLHADADETLCADGPRSSVMPRAVSWLSQPRRWPLYLLAVGGATSVFYVTVGTLGGFATAATPIVFMAVNFHHYIVDGRIWKLRDRTLRTRLGLSSA